MTKDVASSGLFDVGTLDISASVLGQRIGINGRAEQCEKERALFGIDGQLLTSLFDVAGNP